VSRIAKIAISLPEEIFRAVEMERRAKGESRSRFFRRAAERLLQQEQESAAVRGYVRAYEGMPESAEEVEAAQRVGVRCWLRGPGSEARGDRWAELSPPAGRRPVLLLSRNEAYEVWQLVMVAPVTTRVRRIVSEVPLEPEDGLPYTQCATGEPPTKCGRLDTQNQDLTPGLRSCLSPYDFR
jgi:hypothetical protein